MRRTSALVRLERKLATDPYAILSRSEIRLLDREVRRALMSSFPGLDEHLIDRSEDTIRWHALAARCREAAAVVAWITDHLPEGDEHTNVPCRRSPGRRRCRGDIIAELDRTSAYIEWQCPLCGDHGMIHGWEDTLWNRHGGARPGPTAPPSTARH